MDEVQAVVIVGGVAVVLLLAVVVSHNRFVSQRQPIDNAWANAFDVDVGVRDAGPPRVETA